MNRRRRRSNNSLRDISERTGISPSGVSRLLRGRRVPRLDTAQKLAKGLGISVDELLRRLPART